MGSKYPHQSSDNDDLNNLIGKALGQFRIVEAIGAGGMATVFKAYQPNLDRYVAVKVLPVHYAQDPIFVKRFEQEALSVARLNHPNIVQIHDFGHQDALTYIVMEYVDGGTLKDRLKRPLPMPEAVDFIIQAAEGLGCAHRNGIVHRDVKPLNMLLRTSGHLLLSDFGIAKLLEGTTNLTRVGTSIGTPQYMSPEQGTGQPVDYRSDIYSLGIVLFHCLTGRVPFLADKPLTITMMHMNDPLPIDRLVSEGVSKSMVQVVKKMAEKRPDERYESMEAVISALASALAASNLPMPRGRHGGLPLPGLPVGPKSTPLEPLPNRAIPNQGNDPLASVVTLKCFRCDAINPSTQLYCTTCGYDLSNKRADIDRHLGPHGRPILACLTLQNGPMKGRSYRFHQEMTTIGRTTGNDLIIAGRTVSRRHARLWFAEKQWWVEDLQSANGTLINGVRIYQPAMLNDNDIINFGDEIIRFNVI